jgi:HK97 family phage prohead protease
LTAKERDKLNDSDFAYVDSDGEGHLPIHDEAHVRAALGRFSQTEFAADADKTKAAKAIVGAAKGFDIEIDPTSDVGEAAGLKAPESKSENSDTEERAAAAKGDDDSVACPTCDGEGSIKEGNVTCPLCKGDKTVSKAVAAKEAETKSAHRHPPRRQRRALERLPEWRRVTTQFERRVAQEGNDIVLSGVPIVYKSPYGVRDLTGPFRETMHPGVAAQAMESRDFDCRFLLNHEGLPMARSVAGTLTFEEMPRGLRCEPHLDARQSLANDLAVAVERGDITQMSVGFMVADGGDEWRWADDGTEERDVYCFEDLFDVSAVTFPASPSTELELAQRMLSRAGSETRERIRHLFEIGGAVRASSPLTPRDGEELRAVAEALYSAEEGTPLAIRLELYRSANEVMFRALRQGKVLSSNNQQDFEVALEALHTTDDVDIPAITAALETIDKALDSGQAALASVLGRANPDNDAESAEQGDSTAGPPGANARAMQMARLQIIRARELATV